DGALGVASALAAVAELKAGNFNPERAVGIAVFTEEEGARFRVPCLGSRLMTGAIEPEAARALSDDDGVTLAAAMTAAGCDPRLPYARTVLAARRAAADSGALATIGKVIAEPGGANGVSSAVTAWLDARAPDEARLEKTVTAVRSAAMRYSAECGVTLTVRQ